LRSAALAVCATLLLTQGVAVAQPRTALRLVVQDLTGGPQRALLLRCDPTEGPHGQAQRACDDIAAAQGDFARLPGDPAVEFCTLDLRPVVAIARGSWRGHRVDFREEYSNRCLLRIATGPVFDF